MLTSRRTILFVLTGCLIAAHPNPVNADSKSAEVALLRGHYANARKIFVQIARAQRSGAQPGLHQFNVARVSLAEGDYRRAQRECAAIKSLKGDATFWFHLCNARAFLLNRRAAPAEGEMASAVKALGNREFGLEHLHIALATSKLGDLRQEQKAAAKFVHQTLTTAAQAELPPDPSVPYILATLFIECSKHAPFPKQRLRALDEALQRVPNHPDALLRLGTATSDPAILKKASELRPGWVEPLRQLAELSLAKGDTAQAFEAAQSVLKLDRDDRVAIKVAALSAIELADKSAWDRLGRALDRMPNDVDLLMAEADLLHKKGEHEAALEKLERIAALQISNPEPYIECAKIALATSRPKLAGGYLDQALTRDPANATARKLCQKTTCHAKRAADF